MRGFYLSHPGVDWIDGSARQVVTLSGIRKTELRAQPQCIREPHVRFDRADAPGLNVVHGREPEAGELSHFAEGQVAASAFFAHCLPESHGDPRRLALNPSRCDV
jgi:hypothetical protein